MKNKSINIRISVCKILLVVICIFFIVNSSAQDLSLLFHHITVEQGLSQNSVTAIVKDKYGFIWISTLNGLNRYDGYEIKQYKTNLKDSNSISNNRIVMLIVNDNGTLWVETFDNMYNRYNYDVDNFTRISKNDLSKNLLDSLEHRSQNLGSSYKNWRFVLTGEKFRYVNTLTNEVFVLSHDPLDSYSIGDNYVNYAYIDNHNILWLGTNNSGAEKVDLERHPFFHYKHQLNNPNSIISSNIRSILKDKNGVLWIGTRDEGITKFAREKGTYTHIRSKEGNPNSLKDNRVRKLYEDKYGDIWIGTISGLCKYNVATGKFHHYITNTYNPGKEDRINWIIEDHKGDLWVGTTTGICLLDRKKDIFTTFKIETKTQLQGRVRIIMEDKQHALWLGCDGGGLIKLEPNPQATGNADLFISTHYLLGTTENAISDNRVYTLCEDENGNIWIGTAGGLNKFDIKNKTFTHFTEESGIPDNMILGILKDYQGHLWISHKRGITRFNINDSTIRNYSPSDGLQSLEFNEDAYFRSKDGEMFFGGINGFNSFYPDSIADNSYQPQIVFTDFKILNKSVPIGKEFNGRVILEKSITATKEVTLKYLDRSIQIEFAGLHFSDPSANKYEYLLEGFDDEWIITDASHRIASYSNLKPKTYYFKVKASNNDGIWNESPAILKIIMLPPWWKTWWFRIMAGLLIAIIAFSIYFIRVTTLKKQKLMLEAKVNQRTLELKKANTILEMQKNEIDRQKQETERSYNNIKLIGEFGQKLTATLNLESINSMIFDYVKSLMEVTNFGIGIYNSETKSIDFPALLENGSTIDGFSSPLTDTTNCAVWSFKNNKVIFCSNFTNEYSKYISKIHIRTSEIPESLIYLPLNIEQKSIGILTVQSVKKNAYTEQDFSMLQTLASYIAIALHNANIYQQLEKSNEELTVQTDIVKETNALLVERQKEIEVQSEKLKSLNATKDKFFSIIAHDLKNPFGTILGFSEMLIKKFDSYDYDKKKRFIELIHKSSHNVYDLLQNLLQWARSQTGNIEFVPEEFDLKDVINTNIRLVDNMLKRKNLEIYVNVPDNGRVYADKNMINTVIRNLLTNAIKFTDKGIISINTVEKNGYFIVHIKDTGVGIKKNKMNTIFDISDSTSVNGTRGELGTGLGLLLCKEFVEKNGGAITVDSTVGKGSTFSFSIPKV